MSHQNNQSPASIDQLRALVEKQSAALADLESRMNRILQTIPLGRVVVNKRSNIELSNKLAQELFGYEPRELKGRPISLLFPEIAHLQVSSEPLLTNAKKKSGETFPVEIYVNEYDSDFIFAHVQDISERMRLQTLRQQLLNMVSHDLRAPLTSIRMMLGVISGGGYGELPSRAHEAVTRIESNADLMISLVNDLLDSEQMQTGEFQLEIHETTTGSVVSRAIEACLGNAVKAEIGLEQDVSNDTFKADADRLVRVLINLIGNAIKFSPKGSKVTVCAGLDGTRVLFQVRDQGPGIPVEMQSAVFERYRQLEQDTSTKRKGIGLGLYICKTLVERHDGKIWVESKIGSGSTFFFSIPLS